MWIAENSSLPENSAIGTAPIATSTLGGGAIASLDYFAQDSGEAAEAIATAFSQENFFESVIRETPLPSGIEMFTIPGMRLVDGATSVMADSYWWDERAAYVATDAAPPLTGLITLSAAVIAVPGGYGIDFGQEVPEMVLSQVSTFEIGGRPYSGFTIAADHVRIDGLSAATLGEIGQLRGTVELWGDPVARVEAHLVGQLPGSVQGAISAGNLYTPVQSLTDPEPYRVSYERERQIARFFTPVEAVMPVRSFKVYTMRYLRSNVVFNPPMLPGFGLANVDADLSESIESAPSLGLTFTGVRRSHIGILRSAYTHGRAYTFEGIEYEVISYSEGVENLPENFMREMPFRSHYNVSIELECSAQTLMERTTKLKPLIKIRAQDRPDEGLISLRQLAAKVGARLNVPDYQVITGGNASSRDVTTLDSYLEAVARVRGKIYRFNGKSIDFVDPRQTTLWHFIPEQLIDRGVISNEIPPTLRDYEITGDFSNKPDDEDDPQVQLDDPVKDSVFEGDEDPELPPKDSLYLIDLTSNADLSGPTKTITRTDSINGAVALVERRTYGFVYTGLDVRFGNKGKMYHEEPEIFWKLIDYRLETYGYEPLNGGISVSYSIPEPETGRSLPIYLNPDAPGDGTAIVNGSTVTITPETEYLTRIAMTGFIVTRFQKETAGGPDVIPETLQYAVVDPASLDDPNLFAKFKSHMFFTLPVYSERVFTLEAERSHYIENLSEPISYDVVKLDELSLAERRRLGVSDASRKGYIAVVSPTENAKENMLVMAEAFDERGFAWMPHPDTDENQILTPYIVGKEVIQRSIRSILIPRTREKTPKGVSEKYKETSLDFSSSDPGYDVSLAIKKERTTTGRPPTASTREYQFVPKEESKFRQRSRRYRYFVSTDRQNFRTKMGGGESFEQAKSVAAAMRALRLKIWLDTAAAQQVQKKLTWYHPKVRAGDRVNIEGVTYLVLSRNISLSYTQTDVVGQRQGIVDNPCTTEGTTLTLGKIVHREVNLSKRPDDTAQGDGGDAKFTYGGGGATLGELIIEIPSRRSVER